MNKKDVSRRKFLASGSLAMAVLSLGSKSVVGAPAYIKNLNKPNSKFGGVQVGVITYSFRSMPSSAEEILRYCLDAGVSAIELMGPSAEQFAGIPQAPSDNQGASKKDYANRVAEWRSKVSMKKFEQLRKMYNDKGVQIYAFKPSALSEHNTDAEVDYAMRAGKALGASHVTVEYPKNYLQTRRLGEIAYQNDMLVGYHGHTQQTFDMWNKAFIQSANNRANLDMGHYVAAGSDPLSFIKQRHSHICSMHLKDRQTPQNGEGNLPWGNGDTPIVEALQLIKKNKYRFPVSIELEYDIPRGSNAVEEVRKCLEYARKALEG